MKRPACLLALLLMLPSPSAVFAQSKAGNAAKSGDEQLAWPPPPAPTRIKWVGQYRSEFDVGAKKRSGFLDRLAGKSQDAAFLKRPLSVAVDEKGVLFVGDFGLGLVGIDPTGKRMWQFSAVAKMSLATPTGVAVDSKFVYGTDANTNTLAVFDKEGHFIQSIGQSEGIKRPVGVAVDEGRDLLVVVNGGNHNVLLYNRALKLIKKVGSRGEREGQFNFPTYCCIVPGTGFAVADTANFRIQIFDFNGKFLRAFGKAGDTSGCFARPKGIAVDPDGNLHVVDSTFCNFQVFRMDGQVLTHVGQGGTGRGMFQVPSGLAISKDGSIYVADEVNGRIQRFQYIPEAKKEPEVKAKS
jgi:DNA-binding beta-propeller fold protein YncE